MNTPNQKLPLEVIKETVQAMTSNPKAVEVSQRGRFVWVRAAESDMPQLVGKKGVTWKALKTIIEDSYQLDLQEIVKPTVAGKKPEPRSETDAAEHTIDRTLGALATVAGYDPEITSHSFGAFFSFTNMPELDVVEAYKRILSVMSFSLGFKTILEDMPPH